MYRGLVGLHQRAAVGVLRRRVAPR
jgi:hypothetical protein